MMTFLLLTFSIVFVFFFRTSNIYFFCTIFVFLYLTLVIFYTHLLNVVNQLIVPAIRATVISIMNALSSLLMIGFQIVFIYFDNFEIVQTSIFVFLLVGLFLAFISYLIYLIYYPKSIQDKIIFLEKKKEKLINNNIYKASKKIVYLEEAITYLKENTKDI